LSLIYLALLAGVAIMILGALYEAIASVSRKPDWGSHRPLLTVVPVADSRAMDLPFVGSDRRVPAANTPIHPDAQRDAA
jgi:hypothetical protein